MTMGCIHERECGRRLASSTVTGPQHLPAHAMLDIGFGKALAENLSATVSALNITNSRFLLGRASSFAGTHYNDPRRSLCSHCRPGETPCSECSPRFLISAAPAAATTTVSPEVLSLHWPRFVDSEITSADFPAIELRDRFLRSRVVRHLHKAETFRASGIAICDDLNRFNLA